MTLPQHSIIFICIIFFTLQQFTTGLICYECLTCGSVNDNTGTTTVADGIGNSCYKLTGTALGLSFVNRGATMNCTTGSGSIGAVSGSIYCCTSDRCNTGITLSNSFGLTIVTIIAISVIFCTMIMN